MAEFLPYDLPTTDRVYKIKGGRVRTGNVRSRLPHPTVMFTEGRARSHEFAAVNAVNEIVQRVAPWTTVYCGPELWSRNDDVSGNYRAIIGPDGALYGAKHGEAWNNNVVYLRLSDSMPDILSCTHHELFHVCDPLLSDEARSAIDAEIEQGRAYPTDYYRSAVERRARAFEYFAMYCEEGQQQFYLPSDRHSMNSVFLQIYNGDFAAEIMRQRKDLAA
jgi:hypothetical protein